MSVSRLTLISVPFHLGVRGVGVGSGPLDLLGERALADRLRAAGHDVEVDEVPEAASSHETGRIFAIDHELAQMVSSAREAGRMPVIVAGDCHVCVGVLGGISSERCGIVWLDAHADFNTPDTTQSGFFDGMGLAIATGGCWRALAQSIPGFHPVEEQDVIVVGARDVDPEERERLERGRVPVIEGGGGPGTLALGELEDRVSALADRVDGVYLHVDLDVVDTSFGRANAHASAGGVAADEITAVISLLAARIPVLAVSFTAYDPEGDPERRFGETAARVIEAGIAAIARASGAAALSGL